MKIINEKYNDLSSFNIIFKNAKPYPHIILDNFLDENFFLNLNTESFSIQKYRNDHLDTFLERNKSNSRNVDLSYEIKKLVNELNSEKFLTNGIDPRSIVVKSYFLPNSLSIDNVKFDDV